MNTLLGIDLGGTKTRIARYEASTMRLLVSKKFPTHNGKAYGEVSRTLLAQIDEMLSTDTTAIGIGVPGFVDARSGRIMTMPNISGSEDTDLRSLIASHTQLPTVIENDVHCFALGEALFGAGKGASVVVGVTLGTGVGGGIVIDGTIFRGAHGCAGEVGHMLLVPGKPPYDAMNNRGEVEQFFSGTAMSKRCADASRPEDYLSGSTCSFLHADMYEELAWFITNLAYAFDPSIIVFGGAVGRALEGHIEHIERALNPWLLPKTPVPRLAVSTLVDAAPRGAAELARRLTNDT